MGPASIALLPGVSMQIRVEAMTLSVRRQGVQASLAKRSSVVYQGQPPCDPKTLGVRLDQRREIDAWIRSREVQCAMPQRVAVLELDCTCNPLFLKRNTASTKFSCIF